MSQALLDLGGTGGLNARTVSDAISTQLNDVLLSEATDASDAARIIGRNELLLTECRVMLPHVTRMVAGAGYDGVYRALQPLVILFGAPDFGKGREGDLLLESWTVIYAKALHKLTVESLEHAVDQWIVKGKPFFAKPSELYALAEPVHLRANMAAWRMRRAVEMADKAHGHTEISDDERALVKAQFDDLKRQMGVKANPMAAPQRLGRSPHEAAEDLRRAAG